MIFKGSRYSSAEVITSVDADGRSVRVLSARAIPPAPGALEYIVSEGDRLDSLATRFYAEPTRYWLILDANPEPLNPFELLEPGRPIQVPRNRLVGE
jgi:nucleoid-associated protein YgaU